MKSLRLATLLLLLAAAALSSAAARQLADNLDYGIPGLGGYDYSGFEDNYGGGDGGGDFENGSTVCREEGPCLNKKLTCPAKCFNSWSESDANGGGGGGGGGCTLDCKACTSYC